MQVSTAPPYLTASFSIHKDKRPRDTLHNLRTPKRHAQHDAPTPRGAFIVDETATPLPKGQDEGGLLDLPTVDDQPLLIQEAVAAIEAEYVEERYRMRSPRWSFSKSKRFGSPLPRSRAGLGRVVSARSRNMTPSPQGWTQRVLKHYGPA